MEHVVEWKKQSIQGADCQKDVEHRGAGEQKRPLLAGPEAAQKAFKWQESFKLVLKMTSLWLAR